MGVYCINAARYLFRGEPTEIFGLAANDGEKRFKNIEEMTSVVMRFPEERIATFTCSFGAAAVSRFTLIGTKGSLTSDPAYEYAMEIKHELILAIRKRREYFLNVISSPPSLSTSRTAFCRIKTRNHLGSKDWRTCELWKQFTNLRKRETWLNCPSYPPRNARLCVRKFIVRITVSGRRCGRSLLRERQHDHDLLRKELMAVPSE
jgi:GFO/IDH/MocA C-terminal domain